MTKAWYTFSIWIWERLMNVDSLKYKIQQVAGNQASWPEKWNNVKIDGWIASGGPIRSISPPRHSHTELVKIPVRRRSDNHYSQTVHRPATNCNLGQCWTLFSPYNTKGLKIIPYSAQKTWIGPLLRVAHYLTWYSTRLHIWFVAPVLLIPEYPEPGTAPSGTT